MELKIDWIEGFCPVQSEGSIDGRPYYFRARYETWSFEVGDCEWERVEDYGTGPYDAGWMPIDEARKFIEESARMYVEESNV